MSREPNFRVVKSQVPKICICPVCTEIGKANKHIDISASSFKICTEIGEAPNILVKKKNILISGFFSSPLVWYSLIKKRAFNMAYDSLKKLGERIRILRKSQGLTQERLAEKAGMHGKYIGQIERDEINTTVETLDRIATALKVDLSDLFAFSKGRAYPTEKETLLTEITGVVKRGDVEQAKFVLEIARGIEKYKKR